MKRFVRCTHKPILVALVILLILTLSPVIASAKTIGAVPEAPVTFEQTLTVTEQGGNFKFDFVKINFARNCVDEAMPLLVNVEMYAENGMVYIEFTPDVETFNKAVQIKAYKYCGYIFDRATGENIYVEIPSQMLWVTHFSRYCFVF